MGCTNSKDQAGAKKKANAHEPTKTKAVDSDGETDDEDDVLENMPPPA